MDDKEQIKLEFPEGDDSSPPEEPQEKLEVE
jgi:ATP-dependent Clp protease ATP-binding subunit ClpA